MSQGARSNGGPPEPVSEPGQSEPGLEGGGDRTAAPPRSSEVEPTPALPEVPGYRLLRPIGRGSQGAVFLARTADALEKEVALKYFPPLGRRAYEREVRTARAIEAARRETRCPHLVESYAAGELPDGAAHIAMAYYARGSLADEVARAGPVAEARAAAFAGGALAALAVLHGRGIVHGDVKPSNLFVDAAGACALGDFGMARAEAAASTRGGTPAFAAPELLYGAGGGESGPTAGAAADLYSAGATLYWLLTGRAPFPGRPDLFELERRRVSRPLQRVLLQALREAPTERFADAAGFARALGEAVGAAGNAAPEARVPPAAATGPRGDGARARRRLGRAALATAAIAGVVAVVAVAVWQAGAPSGGTPSSHRAATAQPSGDPGESGGPGEPRAASGSAASALANPDAVAAAAPPLVWADLRQVAFAGGTTAFVDPAGDAWLVESSGARRLLGVGATRVSLATADGGVVGRVDGSVTTIDGRTVVPPDGARVAALAAWRGSQGVLRVASAADDGAVRLHEASERASDAGVRGSAQAAEVRPLGEGLPADGFTGLVALAVSTDQDPARLAVGRVATGDAAPPPRVLVYEVGAAGLASQPLATVDGLPPFADVAFLPGGERLAVGLLDGRVAVAPLGEGGGAPTYLVAFAASLEWLIALDAGRVAALGDDRAARVIGPEDAVDADHYLVLEDGVRRVLWPRAPRLAVRILDAHALAAGRWVILDEPGPSSRVHGAPR